MTDKQFREFTAELLEELDILLNTENVERRLCEFTDIDNVNSFKVGAYETKLEFARRRINSFQTLFIKKDEFEDNPLTVCK